MNKAVTQAIVLKRVNYGEADRILTVLTPSGLKSMIAKGVRRPKSKLAGGLELFCVSNITYTGRGDLKTIVSTKLESHLKNIPADITRSMLGYDMLKAMQSYAEHTEESDMFQVLDVGMHGLDDTELASAITMTWFSMQLLHVSGSGINTERPVDAEQFNEQQMYSFSYDDMAFFTDTNGQFSPKHIKFIRLVLRSDSPARLHVIDGADQLAADFEPLAKNLLKLHRA